MAKKPKCEVGFTLTCSGVGVMTLTGPKRGDPVFKCCLGCAAYLKRMGVKTKPAKEAV